MIAWEGKNLVITLFRTWETSVRDYFDAYRAMVKHRALPQWMKRGMIRQVIILDPAISEDLTEQLNIVYDNEGAPAEAVTSRLAAYQRANEIFSSRLEF